MCIYYINFNGSHARSVCYFNKVVRSTKRLFMTICISILKKSITKQNPFFYISCEHID